jgi:hypothetical protein
MSDAVTSKKVRFHIALSSNWNSHPRCNLTPRCPGLFRIVRPISRSNWARLNASSISLNLQQTLVGPSEADNVILPLRLLQRFDRTARGVPATPTASFLTVPMTPLECFFDDCGFFGICAPKLVASAKCEPCSPHEPCHVHYERITVLHSLRCSRLGGQRQLRSWRYCYGSIHKTFWLIGADCACAWRTATEWCDALIGDMSETTDFSLRSE